MPIFGTQNDKFGMTFSMADLTPIANFFESSYLVLGAKRGILANATGVLYFPATVNRGIGHGYVCLSLN